MTPKLGQIWREVDPRTDRYVQVIAISLVYDTVRVQTVDKNEKGEWLRRPKSVSRWAALARFSGKSGGYEYKEG